MSEARARVVVAGLLAGFAVLGARAFYLQVWNSGYLREQGNERHLRVVEDTGPRGMILDRNGEPLAVSTPVNSIWANPAELASARDRYAALGRLIDASPAEIARAVARNRGREFMYLKRQVVPDLAERVMALKIPGVALTREYRRYYPAGSVAAQVVGFTNVDDRGQEGLELAYDDWLRSVPGKKRVLRDRYGNSLEVVESIRPPIPGKDLVLSIDRRIQYLAYRELRASVREHAAAGGTAIVLNARTGEVLALANYPSFNPNNRAGAAPAIIRDRAITDVYEPGSTVKPFTIATALESGEFHPDTWIDTAPGFYKVGRNTIHDTHNYGRITVAQVIQKSSNVGATKISLSLDKRALWRTFRSVGFGSGTGSDLPGEALGVLNPPDRWTRIEQATVSFGYGLSVTPLQLVRAYGALANGGVLLPVTFLKRDAAPAGVRVLDPTIVSQIRDMLEMVVTKEGTARAAEIPHYLVAGKTGTVHKVGARGYEADDYIGSFVGFAPASDPRLVMLVMVDSPMRDGYYGGEVAAPVFGRVMAGALRLLDIPPDAPFEHAPAQTIVRADPGWNG